MEKELKNIGDTVWTIMENRVVEVKITDIMYYKSISNYDYENVNEVVKYNVRDGRVSDWYYDTDLFDTKDELINSL